MVLYNCKRPRETGELSWPKAVLLYYRVSTEKQGSSGLGLEAQRRAVEAYLNGGSGKLQAEFTEIESGKRADRPKLAEAIKVAKRHKATLVIAKLDRLSRNVAFCQSAFKYCRPNDNPSLVILRPTSSPLNPAQNLDPHRLMT